MFDSLWKSTVDVIVPVYGGMWDGATCLATDLKPGKVTVLNGERYIMTWHGNQPRLEKVK